jgi:DNA-binding NarL/FixJ family response regulator
MTQELIENVISSEEGMAVTARGQEASVVDSVEQTAPDVVIVGRDDPGLAASLLADRPRLKMLAVVDDDRESVLYELQPLRHELGELTPEMLVAALRGARDPRSDWMP